MSPSEQSKDKSQNSRQRLRAFDRSLPMSLLKAREAVVKKFMPSLKAEGLTTQQWRVIRALEQHGEMELTELAEVCFILKPSMTRIVQNLEGREIISRHESEQDRRCSSVKLTDSGHNLFEKIAPASIERYEFITDKFGYGKLELLYQLLDELIDALYEETDPKHTDDV
jgi:homoprotocatechuate degradation regulator HpaR